MTARQDKHGKHHNTLDHPALDAETAARIKAELFDAIKPATPDAKRAVAQVHKASGEK